MFFFKEGHIVCGTTIENGKRRYTIGTVSQVLRGEQGVTIEITTPGGTVHQFQPRDVRPVISIILGKDRRIGQLTAFRYKATEVLKEVAIGANCSTEAGELLKFFDLSQKNK